MLALDAQNGGRFTRAIFDLNNDGKVDDNDKVTIPGAGSTTLTVSTSGFLTTGTGQEVTTLGGTGTDTLLPTGNPDDAEDIDTGDEDVGRQSWRQIK